MTVKILCELLSRVDPEAEVRLWCCGDHGEFPVIKVTEDPEEKCVTLTY